METQIQTPKEPTRTELSAPTHTPGPWLYTTDCARCAQYDSENGFPTVMTVGPDGGKMNIAEVKEPSYWESYPRATRGTRHHGDRYANGQLIAAAPDLLDACREALAESYPLPAWLICKLEAAITKATAPYPRPIED